MQPMQLLRNARHITRFMLVWFVLAMGVAMASPLIKPEAMALVCSGSGAMKLVVGHEDGSVQVGTHTLDCALCVTVGAPPPVVAAVVAAPSLLAWATQSIPAARISALTAAPLPARGPPLL